MGSTDEQLPAPEYNHAVQFQEMDSLVTPGFLNLALLYKVKVTVNFVTNFRLSGM